MADSTKSVVVKESDGSVVPSTFFEDNAPAVIAAAFTGITAVVWNASKGGLVITTAADGDVFVPCYQVPT